MNYSPDLIKVSSSFIEAVGYGNFELYIKFNSGTIYKYKDVPVSVYDKILELNECDESIGQYFHSDIAPNYSCEKIGYVNYS